MATSKIDGVKTLMVGLLSPFYHNFPPVNKKFRWVLDNDFGDAYAGGFVYSEHCAAKKRSGRLKYSQITGSPSLCRNLIVWSASSG
jgi:hypothetical protein